MPFVLDNSVVSAWYLSGQSTDYSQAIAARLETDKALVPPLWQLEHSNVLKTACTRGRLTHTVARQILDTLGQLPIDVDAGAPPGQRQAAACPASPQTLVRLPPARWVCQRASA